MNRDVARSMEPLQINRAAHCRFEVCAKEQRARTQEELHERLHDHEEGECGQTDDIPREYENHSQCSPSTAALKSASRELIRFGAHILHGLIVGVSMRCCEQVFR